MLLPSLYTSPFQLQLCFSQVFDHLETVAADTANDHAASAQHLLQQAAAFPELRTGLSSHDQITQHAGLIKKLTADYFPAALTHNEIKAITIPFTDYLFNTSERLTNILAAAGNTFDVTIRDFDEHTYYVMSCCIILGDVYNVHFDFSRPLFYDIPTADGIIKHYRILYNADFLDVYPTEKAVALTPDDIELLRNNYDNLALWKEKFPPYSWVLKGFAILTLYDATTENAVSILKEKLLGLNAAGFRNSIEGIFQSIYKLKHIQVGFSVFNPKENTFTPDVFGQQLPSFMVGATQQENASQLLCKYSYRCLIDKKTYFAVSDTAEYQAISPANHLAGHFLQQGIRSFILAPVVKNDTLFGVLEIVSTQNKVLNSINAHKLAVVMPFITDTIERLAAELQNQIQAVIQEKYTTIHKSVYWKFHAEAEKHILALQLGETHELQEMIFPDVHPLYGQVDIKGSSEARNRSVQQDIQMQLSALLTLLKEISTHPFVPSFHEEIQQLQQFYNEATLHIQAATEQYITAYLNRIIHPRLQEINQGKLQAVINEYLVEAEKGNGIFQTHRRKYENTIAIINSKLSQIIDSKQEEAQAVFSHYFDRFKTDGIEHNMYVGASIAPEEPYDALKLYQLRLWQLQVLCEMEIAHHQLLPALPIPLEVTTLILVYHSTIDIRFRMDEKRFDVDGSYNARYEIVKKRIDKACIKNTTERITQSGKLTIVYSNEAEQQEYLQYIQMLQSRMLLEKEIEQWDVEDLQGVSGLKMLRVKMNHQV